MLALCHGARGASKKGVLFLGSLFFDNCRHPYNPYSFLHSVFHIPHITQVNIDPIIIVVSFLFSMIPEKPCTGRLAVGLLIGSSCTREFARLILAVPALEKERPSTCCAHPTTCVFKQKISAWSGFERSLV